MISYLDFIDETNRTEEEVTREQQETYLAGLVREKQGYEQRLIAVLSDDTPDEAKASTLRRRVKDVEAELTRVGETRVARDMISK